MKSIITERLILRSFIAADIDTIYTLRSSSKVLEFIQRTPLTKQEAKNWFEKINAGAEDGKWFNWAISSKTNKEMIGSICLWNFNDKESIAEIGYDLLPEHWKNGYMNEAMRAVIDYAKTLERFKFIDAYTHKNNQASKALLNRNGFIFKKHFIDKDLKDNDIFRLTL